MESKALLKCLVAAFGLGTGLAVAQLPALAPAGPEASRSISGPEDGASLRALLAKGGRISYQTVDLASGSRSSITLRHLKDNEYLRSDGVRFRDLTEVVHDAQFDYSSPVPLVVAPLAAGQIWKYSGAVTSRLMSGSSRDIESKFRVVGKTTVATLAGERSAVEVVETSAIGADHEYVVHRFVDERLGVVIKEVWETTRDGPRKWGPFTAATIRKEITLTSLPVIAP